MPESELLYPDVEQEEQDMDLQHAARWAMENEDVYKRQGVQGAVIHVQRVLAPRLGLELGGCQQPLGFQSIQIHEIRVARKGRAALVGAVPIARGAQGQDLPDLLALSLIHI